MDAVVCVHEFGARTGMLKKNTTVLVVEDDVDMQNLVKKSLAGLCVGKVERVSEGKKAIGLLEARGVFSYHLVVLDINLPDISGVEVLRYIRFDKDLKNKPVVVLSGVKDRDKIVEIAKLGITDYLVKPLKPMALGDIINKLFS